MSDGGRFESGGFTLAELAAVMAILAVLLGMSVFSLSGWQTMTTFEEQNETARLLFDAAQNKLTSYESCGTADDFYNTLEQNGAKKLADSELIGAHAAITEDVYSVIVTPDDYEIYLAGDKSSKRARLVCCVYDMFSGRVYDEQVLNEGVICLEVACKSGRIYAVLYSNRDSGFEYNPSLEAQEGGIADVSCRLEDYRKLRMVGFCGVDSLD